MSERELNEIRKALHDGVYSGQQVDFVFAELATKHAEADALRRQLEEARAENARLREALELIQAVRADVISVMIAGRIPGWQRIDEAFKRLKAALTQSGGV